MTAMPTLLILSLVGGGLFWTPTVVLHVWRGPNFSGADAMALTGLLPVVGVAVAFVGRSVAEQTLNRPAVVPLAVCCGVWVLGPVALFIGATPTGGGFASPDAWRALVFLTAIFPVATFSMSAYDGSLGGLLLAIVVLIVLTFRVSSERPVTRGAE